MSKKLLELRKIMGNVNIVQYRGKARQRHDELTEEEKEEQRVEKTKEICIRRKSTMKKNKRLLEMTVTFLKDSPFHQRLMRENGAVQTHLVSFCGIAQFALENKYHVGYGEYRKRLEMKELKKEWSNIRAWISRHAIDDVYLAVSIGVWNKGYVYIRFIVTSENDLHVHDMALQLAHYLRKTKRFNPKELKPYEKNPQTFIKSKYANDSIGKFEDIVTIMPDELWQSFKASLCLPFTRRTFKSDKARELLEDMAGSISLSDVEDYGLMMLTGNFKAFAVADKRTKTGDIKHVALDVEMDDFEEDEDIFAIDDEVDIDENSDF